MCIDDPLECVAEERYRLVRVGRQLLNERHQLLRELRVEIDVLLLEPIFQNDAHPSLDRSCSRLGEGAFATCWDAVALHEFLEEFVRGGERAVGRYEHRDVTSICERI